PGSPARADDGILERIEKKLDDIKVQLDKIEFPVPEPQPQPPASDLKAFYLGQTGEYKAGQGNTLAPNGVKDLHIFATGLRAAPVAMTITAIGTSALWNTPLLPAGNFLVASELDGKGNADFWFEPFGTVRVFHLKLTYADQSTDEADAIAPPCAGKF